MFIQKDLEIDGIQFHLLLNCPYDKEYLLSFLSNIKVPNDAIKAYIIETISLKQEYFFVVETIGGVNWCILNNQYEVINKDNVKIDNLVITVSQDCDNIFIDYQITLIKGCDIVLFLLDLSCDIFFANSKLIRFGPIIIVTPHNNIIKLKYSNNSNEVLDSYSKKILVPLVSNEYSFSLNLSEQIESNYNIKSNGAFFLEDIVIYKRVENPIIHFEYSNDSIKNLSSNFITSRWNIIKELNKIIMFYNELFEPIEFLKIISHDYLKVNAVSYSNLIMANSLLAKYPTNLLFEYLPHEIGHQWFGNKTKFLGSNAYYLMEAIVEHLQLLYMKKRFGEQFYFKRLNWYKKQLKSDNKERKGLSIYFLKWHYFYLSQGEEEYKWFLKSILRRKYFKVDNLEIKLNRDY